MTCIVSPKLFTSKAALKALAEGEGFMIEDPSIVAPRLFRTSEMEVGQREVITNHPLRTKFAQIERTAKGWKVS